MGWRGCSRVTTLSWWSRRCSIMLYNEIAISRKSGACWTAKAMELPLRKVISNNNSYLFPLFYPFQSPSSVKIQIHLRVSSSQMKDTCRSLEYLTLFSHTIIIQLKIMYEIFFYQGCFSILNNFFNWNFILFVFTSILSNSHQILFHSNIKSRNFPTLPIRCTVNKFLPDRLRIYRTYFNPGDKTASSRQL